MVKRIVLLVPVLSLLLASQQPREAAANPAAVVRGAGKIIGSVALGLATNALYDWLKPEKKAHAQPPPPTAYRPSPEGYPAPTYRPAPVSQTDSADDDDDEDSDE